VTEATLADQRSAHALVQPVGEAGNGSNTKSKPESSPIVGSLRVNSFLIGSIGVVEVRAQTSAAEARLGSACCLSYAADGVKIACLAPPVALR
jgi:hypothetical protein